MDDAAAVADWNKVGAAGISSLLGFGALAAIVGLGLYAYKAKGIKMTRLEKTLCSLVTQLIENVERLERTNEELLRRPTDDEVKRLGEEMQRARSQRDDYKRDVDVLHATLRDRDQLVTTLRTEIDSLNQALSTRPMPKRAPRRPR